MTIRGTAGRDHIRATRRRDVIAALDGDDRVSRLGVSDFLCAGAGSDRVRMRRAETSGGELDGGPGADVFKLACPRGPGVEPDWGWAISGGRGDDLIDVDCPNPDRLGGAEGDDKIIFGNGYDRVDDYPSGDDTVIDAYSRGNECQEPPPLGYESDTPDRRCHPTDSGIWDSFDDYIFGFGGDDRIFAGDGPDFLVGDNTIDDFRGNDFLRGGGGNDALTGGPGHDVCHGGPGDRDYNGTFNTFESMLMPYDCEKTRSVENPRP